MTFHSFRVRRSLRKSGHVSDVRVLSHCSRQFYIILGRNANMRVVEMYASKNISSHSQVTGSLGSFSLQW